MWLFVVLLLVEFSLSTALAVLNLRHLRRKAASLPPEWAASLDSSQFPRMVAYAEANSRLGHWARTADLAITLLVLCSGLLPAVSGWAARLPVGRVGQGLAVLAVLAGIWYVGGVPWELLFQFGVEKRFGFSTITVKTWLTDQVKSLLVTLVLGALLSGGLLFLVGWLGRGWWLPAWALFSLFELMMVLVAPVLILPLFNKFQPLEDQELGAQILALASQARFPVRGVYQMDASIRSRHTNAFFTGLGKTRRIALFDTLLAQHPHQEILAILAHEIGHWKKRHILQRIAVSLAGIGLALWLVAALLDHRWLYEAAGVGHLYARVGPVGPVAAVGLYLMALLLSPLGLLGAPLFNWLSRRQEYQADAYSLALYPHPTALERALLNLHEKNLANLFPHPLVVAFRYSHPPLLERIAAIRRRRADGVCR